MALLLEASAAVPANAEVLAFVVSSDMQALSAERAFDDVSARRRGFSGGLGETLVVNDTTGTDGLAVGLGDPSRVDREALRRVGAGAARAAKDFDVLFFDLAGIEESTSGISFTAAVSAIAEGALLGSYTYTTFKSQPKADALTSIVFVHPDRATVTGALARAQAICDAVFLARDLINTPAGALSPTRFAEIARERATTSGVSITVFDEIAIANERLGGLAGVAAGSDEPARMVLLSYEPEETSASVPSVALVGKGITFDSGGLSLKSAEGMMTMKTDMSGAAAVLATVLAAKALALPVRVLGYMPITENMPGGRAIKPGDVLKIRNGKTIEVLNTDAEGRLVLADALSLATEQSPDAIIDLATLTGACVAALGRSIAGVLGNDDRLIDALLSASRAAGEPLWPLPLPSGYRSQIDSEVADMKNIGPAGQGGAITAALLLEEFVGEAPWAHLDIAGPARSEEDNGYLRKGGTGFGVRTLIELLEHYQPFGATKAPEATGSTVLR